MKAALRRSASRRQSSSSEEDSIDVLRREVMAQISPPDRRRKKLFDRISKLEFTLPLAAEIEKCKKQNLHAAKVSLLSPRFQRPQPSALKVNCKGGTYQESTGATSGDSGIQRSAEPIGRQPKKNNASSKLKEQPPLSKCYAGGEEFSTASDENGSTTSEEDTVERAHKKLMEDLDGGERMRLFSKNPAPDGLKLRRSVFDRARKKAVEVKALQLISSTPANVKLPSKNNSYMNLSPITKDCRAREALENSVKVSITNSYTEPKSNDPIQVLSSNAEENFSRLSKSLKTSQSDKRKRSRDASPDAAGSSNSRDESLCSIQSSSKRSRLHSFVTSLKERPRSPAETTLKNLSKCLSRNPFQNLQDDIDDSMDEEELSIMQFVTEELVPYRVGKKIMPKTSNVGMENPWRLPSSDFPSSNAVLINTTNYSRDRLSVNRNQKLTTRGCKPKKSFVNRKTLISVKQQDLLIERSTNVRDGEKCQEQITVVDEMATNSKFENRKSRDFENASLEEDIQNELISNNSVERSGNLDYTHNKVTDAIDNMCLTKRLKLLRNKTSSSSKNILPESGSTRKSDCSKKRTFVEETQETSITGATTKSSSSSKNILLESGSTRKSDHSKKRTFVKEAQETSITGATTTDQIPLRRSNRSKTKRTICPALTFLVKSTRGWDKEQIVKMEDAPFKLPAVPPVRKRKTRNQSSIASKVSESSKEGNESSSASGGRRNVRKRLLKRKSSSATHDREEMAESSKEESKNSCASRGRQKDCSKGKTRKITSGATTSTQCNSDIEDNGYATSDQGSRYGTGIDNPPTYESNITLSNNSHNSSVPVTSGLKTSVCTGSLEPSIIWSCAQPNFSILDNNISNKIWFAPTGQDNKQGLSCGLLKFEPSALKPNQLAKSHSLIFYVITGKCKVSVNNEQNVLSSNSTFIVPRGCAYSIKNSSRSAELLIFFTRTRKDEH